MANIDFDSLQTITAANLLKSVNHAIAHLNLGGQSYTINGRTYTRAQLPDLMDARDRLQKEISESASPTGRLTALGKFGRQQ